MEDWKKLGEVELLVCDQRRFFYNLGDLVATLGWKNICRLCDGKLPDVTVNNSSNEPLSCDLIKEVAQDIGLDRYGFTILWNYSDAKGYVFRSGQPVPAVGTVRRGRYRRYPKTTQELRESFYLDGFDDDAKMVRATVRRKRHALPTAYSDLYRGLERTWKRHRRLRW